MLGRFAPGVVLLVPLLLGSQRTAAQDRPVFSAKSELVVLHVNVEDRKGAYVAGLPQAAFTVYDDGEKRELKFFSAADTPASIGILVDNSTSMFNKRDKVIAAALGFTELSNPEDELFVLAFNEDVSEIWAPRVIGETNLVSMRATLTGGIGARGKTALFDAVMQGLDRLNDGRHPRQVLILISDGSDNASSRTLEEVLARSEQSDAAIFSVFLRDSVDRDANPKLLRRITAGTGGESFEPDTIADIPETLRHIARDIRSAYTLGFEPLPTAARGATHKLRVMVRSGGRVLKARTRGGYVRPDRTESEQ